MEDGLTGTENQCIGVAKALGVKPDIKRIKLKFPWSFLSPHVRTHDLSIYTPDCLSEPYPDILIAAGRKSVEAARIIRLKTQGKTFTVQLQDPKVSPSDFSLVAVPHHDPLRGENVIVTDGAPNKITPELLAKAKDHFAPLFEPLKTPRIAVLIGGKSKAHDITPIHAHSLVKKLQSIEGGLMVTASRRTAKDSLDIFQNGLAHEGNFFWDGHGENPYLGMLAWADHILVTEDSVSMISDAGSTGKPVHIIDVAGGSARFDMFKDHIKALGVARDFTGGPLAEWRYEPLNDSQKVADAIKSRIK